MLVNDFVNNLCVFEVFRCKGFAYGVYCFSIKNLDFDRSVCVIQIYRIFFKTVLSCKRFLRVIAEIVQPF